MSELSLQTTQNDIMAAKTLLEAVTAREMAAACIKKAKALKVMADEYIIDLAEAEGVKKIDLPDDRVVLIGKKKVTKFDTEKVYDLFGFTEVQRDILPKNPKFRKTGVVAMVGADDTETLAEVVKESYDDTVTVQDIDKKYLK